MTNNKNAATNQSSWQAYSFIIVLITIVVVYLVVLRSAMLADPINEDNLPEQFAREDLTLEWNEPPLIFDVPESATEKPSSFQIAVM